MKASAGNLKYDNKVKIGKYSPKTQKFLEQPLKRFNMMEGSIRSSKTFSAVVKTIQYIVDELDTESDEKSLFLFGGATQSVVNRNILGTFFGILNEYFPTVKWQYNEKWNIITIGNFEIHILGYNTIRASTVILGSTLQFALLDEVNHCDSETLHIIMDRMSQKNSKLISTFNPQSPNHIIYKEFIDNESLSDDLIHWHYTLDDNPNLDADYVKSLYRRYPVGSVNYRTKILGLRGAELNSIYGEYVRDSTFISEIPEFPIFSIGIDIGWSSETAITLVNMAVDKKEIKKAIVIKEVKLDGKKVEITIDMITKEILRLVKYVNTNHNTGCSVCIPHDGVSLFNEIKKYTIRYVFKPILVKPDAYDAIEQVRDLFHRGILLINKNCQHCIDSIYSYAFKEDSNGEYKIDKNSNDHFCDSFRLALIEPTARKKFKERRLDSAEYHWNNKLNIEILKPNNRGWKDGPIGNRN
jgi:PBSX family phage terminase large subunit